MGARMAYLETSNAELHRMALQRAVLCEQYRQQKRREGKQFIQEEGKENYYEH